MAPPSDKPNANKDTTASSSSANTAADNSLKLDDQTRDQQPAQAQIMALEEDDEFEEFSAQDWEDAETYLDRATKQPGTDHLWEDNWDDDDVEDEFSLQLRSELTKTGQGTTGVVNMTLA